MISVIVFHVHEVHQVHLFSSACTLEGPIFGPVRDVKSVALHGTALATSDADLNLQTLVNCKLKKRCQ